MRFTSPIGRAIALATGCFALARSLRLPSLSTAFDRSSAEATLWQLLNGARVNNGLAPLQQHATLLGLARWRSADMLERDYFSHTIAGSGCLVYCWYDSNGIGYAWAGENIGWNSGLDDSYSPVRVHEAFMASPGHRANVLDPRFSYGAVGAAAADNQMFAGYLQNTRMYTELFLQPLAPAPAAPAPAAPSNQAGGQGTHNSPAAPAPAAAPPPKPVLRPLVIEMDAPRRPTSAKIDGVSERVPRHWPIRLGAFRPI